MKFAYLVAKDVKIIDSGIIEVESISLFFDNYVKEKGYYKNSVFMDSDTGQYRSLLIIEDKPLSQENTAGILAFIVP